MEGVALAVLLRLVVVAVSESRESVKARIALAHGYSSGVHVDQRAHTEAWMAVETEVVADLSRTLASGKKLGVLRRPCALNGYDIGRVGEIVVVAGILPGGECG